MSRGLGEMEIIAVRAMLEHSRKHAASQCLQYNGRLLGCTADGYALLSTLREIAGFDHQYRGTEDAHRRNHRNAFKRALDRLVAKGYADRRDFEPGYLQSLPLWERLRPRRLRWQYRPTEKIRSVEQRVNAYSELRLTTKHSPAIEATKEAATEAYLKELQLKLGLPDLRRH